MGKKKPNLSLRYFLLAFGLSFLILSLIALPILLWTVHPRGEQVGTPQSGIAVESVPGSYTDRENILVCLRKNKSDSPYQYLLLGFLPDRLQLSLTVFTPNTPLSVEHSAGTLEQAYQYGGCGEASRQLAKEMRISIGKYIDLTDLTLSNAVDLAGGFSYDFSSPLTLPNGISISSGSQYIGGELFVSLLHYAEQTEDSRIPLKLYSKLMGNILAFSDYSQIQSYYQQLINSMETDISLHDLAEHEEAITLMLNRDYVHPAPYTGNNFAQLAEEYR
ncbi:MAG TPA: hypothetical protein H9662_06680 [Firmicutes bacterium]|nr:hypothetical protein [Bacillota bacterium]